MRDYDATRRDTNKEYIFVLEEGEGSDGITKQEEGDKAESASHRAKGAYYVPLISQTVLRKRRARKGEARNDYDDLGLEFWGGMLVSLGGKEVFPEDEVQGRLGEFYSLQPPPEEAQAPTQEEVTETNGH